MSDVLSPMPLSQQAVRRAGHDVFISYSSKDRPAGDETCRLLELHDIRCWIAPRNIVPGAEWAESIIGAIHSARLMVVILSDNANQSRQVSREVERAVNKGIPVVPVRIADVLPSRSLEYYVSSAQWHDAFPPPIEHHLVQLAGHVRAVLEIPQVAQTQTVSAAQSSASVAVGVSRFGRVPYLFGAVVVCLAVAGAVITLERAPAPPAPTKPDTPVTSNAVSLSLDHVPVSLRSQAHMIGDAFARAGFGEVQQVAAIANAMAESHLNPTAHDQTTDSWGLFQLSRKSGLGAGKTPEDLIDPTINVNLMIALAKTEPQFAAATTVQGAVDVFVRRISRPSDSQSQTVRQMALARELFPLSP